LKGKDSGVLNTMPIYEFQCVDCKEVFEEMVPVGRRTQKCPVCGGKGKKLISPVGIVFKGSGFYCTDHRNSDGNGSKKVSKEETEVTEKLAEAKTVAEKSDTPEKKKSPKKKPDKD
jgi:putative FmdB family regulatory protein